MMCFRNQNHTVGVGGAQAPRASSACVGVWARPPGTPRAFGPRTTCTAPMVESDHGSNTVKTRIRCARAIARGVSPNAITRL